VEYKNLVEQNVHSFNICENPKLLESLALMDGAVIIDKKGFITAYGAKLKANKVLKNFGTRHSAAISAAKGDNLVVVVSEEDMKVRVLKQGKMIMQIDALQKNVEKSVPHAVEFLESIGAGTVGALGTSLLVPVLGITFLPGVVLFGSAYYIAKLISKKFNGG
ncbi:MAG: DNA integrity scanning protein DisA nucleotide-binding domain protein, partial [Nanoarchaeota archaeon]